MGGRGGGGKQRCFCERARSRREEEGNDVQYMDSVAERGRGFDDGFHAVFISLFFSCSWDFCCC